MFTPGEYQTMTNLRTAIEELDDTYFGSDNPDDPKEEAEYNKKRAELVAKLDAWMQNPYEDLNS